MHTPRRWGELGWSLLCRELPRQVAQDGVDYEASTAYHRLVTELFLLPALYRERVGLPVEAGERAKPDGTVIRWRSAGLEAPQRDASLPFFIGRPGWLRSSAWIWLFSSTDNTMAWAGGST